MQNSREIRDTIVAQACAEFKHELLTLMDDYVGIGVLNMDIIKALLFEQISKIDVAQACVHKMNKEAEE